MKAIAFPTDARLYHKARVTLVRLAKQLGITLRQSYLRVGKRALFMHQRYGPVNQGEFVLQGFHSRTRGLGL